MRVRFLKKYLFPISLFLLAIITHLTIINTGFIWLDHIDIEEKSAVVNSPLQVFTSPYSQTTFYRPVIAILHTVNYHMFGLWAPGYHLTNSIIHALVVVLSFLFIKKVTGVAGIYAFLTSLIVMLHPASLYSVGLISYRTDPAAVLFMLGALLYLFQFLERDKVKQLIIAGVLFFIALLAKETVIFWYPGILIAVYVRNPLLFKNKLIKITVVTLATILIFLIFRYNATHSLWGVSSPRLNPSQSIGTKIKTTALLGTYLLFPALPPIRDTVKIATMSDSVVIVSILLLITISIILYRYRKNREIIFFAFLFCVSVVPATNIVPLPRALSPHYLYFTVIIGAVLIAAVLNQVTLKFKKIMVFGIIVWSVYSGFISLVNGPRFANDLTFFLPEVQKEPHYREGAYYVGSAYLKQRNFSQSEKYLLRALTDTKEYLSYVDTSTTANNLAVALIQQNKLSQAEKYLEQSVREDTRSTHSRKLYNLAVLKLQLNKAAEVIPLVEHEIISTKQAPFELYLVLAQAYIKTNQKDKADLLLRQVEPLLRSKEEKDLWRDTKRMLP